MPSIDVPFVSEHALENWKKFLQRDAIANGGTASMLFRLQPGDQKVKITCCSQVIIVEFLTDIEFDIESATFFVDVD